MTSIFNNAVGCYDRMLHNLMIVTTRRMSCPKEAALCHAKVLNQMKHFIKTAMGVSENCIQASPTVPLAGCGQNNGGRPISWHAHMEPLLAAYSNDNPGFSFEDPAQAIIFLQCVVGYIDDNSLILTFRDGQSTQEALAEAQKALTSWKNYCNSQGATWH